MSANPAKRVGELEQRAGRERPYRNAPRTLDLDLLLFDDAVIDTPRLVLPHPRMHLRAFVMAPLAEIAPDCRMPGRGRVAAWLPAVRMQRIERIETHEWLGDTGIAPA